MFTGIIEITGTVRSQKGQDLWIDPPRRTSVPFTKELKNGQSVAVNGACLTVVEKDRQGFKVQLLDETKRLTNLGSLKKGHLVNLERAMKFGDRLDGHMVQGHVEGVGKVLSLRGTQKQSQMNGRLLRRPEYRTSRNDRVLLLKVPQKLLKYIILKGIIVLDGIALTLTKIDDKKAEIEVAIIPYTWQNTNLRMRRKGDLLNIETDVIGKYVEKLINQ